MAARADVGPRLFVDLYRAFRVGDLVTAERLRDLVNSLRAAANTHTFPSVAKAAMQMAGLAAGPCRKPAGPMPPDARADLARIMDNLREQNYYKPDTDCFYRRNVNE